MKQLPDAVERAKGGGYRTFKRREWRRVSYQRSAMGRSNFDLECPFCSSIVTVYAWSFAGNGSRKCEGEGCGAVHVYYGYTKRDSDLPPVRGVTVDKSNPKARKKER